MAEPRCNNCGKRIADFYLPCLAERCQDCGLWFCVWCYAAYKEHEHDA